MQLPLDQTRELTVTEWQMLSIYLLDDQMKTQQMKEGGILAEIAFVHDELTGEILYDQNNCPILAETEGCLLQHSNEIPDVSEFRSTPDGKRVGMVGHSYRTNQGEDGWVSFTIMMADVEATINRLRKETMDKFRGYGSKEICN